MAFGDPQQGNAYYGKAVLWMGLILIVLNMYANGGWSNLWSILTTKGTTAAPH